MTEIVLVVGTSSALDSWKESDVRQCSGNDLSAKSHMNGTTKPEILRQTAPRKLVFGTYSAFSPILFRLLASPKG